MNNAEKVRKITLKAMDNKWVSAYGIWVKHFDVDETFISEREHLKYWFEHDFLKAYFGEEPMAYYKREIDADPVEAYLGYIRWQYHAMHAVISDDPIAYYWGFYE